MHLFRSACLLMLIAPQALGAGAREHVSSETGLSSWRVEEPGFSIELVQVLPDYVRAVYAARGLPQSIVDKVSGYCVFGTILKNTSAKALSYDVREWRFVTADGKTHRARSKSDWVREWRELGVAFRWSMLPEQQTYSAGDWGQGFTTVDLPRGTAFDLHYSWQQGGVSHQGIIRGLRCAPADIQQD